MWTIARGQFRCMPRFHQVSDGPSFAQVRVIGEIMAMTSTAIGTMKVAQITRPGGGFEIVEREIPDPGVGQVRIKVQACGICHSDVLVTEGKWPGIRYPRVPGYEVAGIIDELGPGVSAWKRGQRVGVGWHGGQD